MDFIEVLPHDVLYQIFGHYKFTFNDYVTFVNVSTSWREKVPVYSIETWTDVTIEMGTWLQTTKPADIACYLGSLVCRVVVKNFVNKNNNEYPMPLVNLLKLLVQSNSMNIQCLVFQHCCFDMNSEVLPYFHLLGENLTELSFLKHQSNMSFIDTIAIFPKLAQFSFSFDSSYWSTSTYADTCINEPKAIINQDAYLLGDININETDKKNKNNLLVFSTITCISIDAAIAHRQRLQPLLTKTPNLRILRIHNNCPIPPIDLILTGQLDLDINDIMAWCPLLQYLECNTPQNVPRRDVEQWMKGYRKNMSTIPTNSTLNRTTNRNILYTSNTTVKVKEENGGLQTLIYYEGRQEEYRSVLTNIRKHAVSLHTLVISSGRSDAVMNWNALTDIFATRLRSLKVDDINCSEESLAKFVSHCYGLKDLYLHVQRQQQTTTYQLVYNALQNLSSTRTTKLSKLTVKYLSTNNNLQRHRNRHHHQSEERNYENINDRINLFDPLCQYLRSNASSALNELCIFCGPFELNYDHISLFSSLLASSTTHSTRGLRTLKLHHQPCPLGAAQQSENELSATAETSSILQKLIQLSSIEKLVFVRVVPFNNELFDILGEMKHLRILELTDTKKDGHYAIENLANFLKNIMPINYLKLTKQYYQCTLVWRELFNHNRYLGVDLHRQFKERYSITIDKHMGTSWYFMKIKRNTWEEESDACSSSSFNWY